MGGGGYARLVIAHFLDYGDLDIFVIEIDFVGCNVMRSKVIHHGNAHDGFVVYPVRPQAVFAVAVAVIAHAEY